MYVGLELNIHFHTTFVYVKIDKSIRRFLPAVDFFFLASESSADLRLMPLVDGTGSWVVSTCEGIISTNCYTFAFKMIDVLLEYISIVIKE